MKSKPKVAIVRGPALSKWEMQMYEPLLQWFDIFAIGTTKVINDCEGIKFPIKQLVCPALFVSGWPKLIPAMFYLTGDTQWLMGFDEAIAGVDLLHSVDPSYGYTLQAVWAVNKGLVQAVTMTNYETIPYLYNGFEKRRRIKKFVIEHATGFMPANDMARQALLVEGADERRIDIVPQSVDTHIFRPGTVRDIEENVQWRERLGIGRDDLVVLFVGRMVWEKGLFDIIPAAAYVKSRVKKIKFVLVGDGLELKQAKQLTSREGLEEVVVFGGLVPYREMPALFRMADMFLYPTLPTRDWNAQFGGVLIEAMATGLPIVGTLAGGTRDDTVGKDGGIFVQPQHFSGLGYAIVRLATDKKLRTRIALRNRRMAVKKYDIHVVAKQIKRVWEKALE